MTAQVERAFNLQTPTPGVANQLMLGTLLNRYRGIQSDNPSRDLEMNRIVYGGIPVAPILQLQQSSAPTYDLSDSTNNMATTHATGYGFKTVLFAGTDSVTAQPVTRVAQSQTSALSAFDSISAVIGRFGEFSNYSEATAVMTRLFELKLIADEEGIAISVGSLKQFLRFLDANSWLAKPEIVISTASNLRCQWSKRSNQHLVIEFFSSGDAQFVVFAPNEAHDNRVTRVSGACTQDMIFRYVDAYKVRSWASSGR